jgi:ABC-2 family transporter protein
MIWLTWRQHRQQALAGAIGLALIGAFMLLTHPGIAHFFQVSGAAGCLSIPGRDCHSVTSVFNDHYSGLQFLVPLFLVVPLFVGLFWGAPLVAREVEQETHRLVWTQGVTRRRWIAWKLALIGAAAVAGAAAFAALVTWWSAMFVQTGDDRLSPGVFDIRGIVPIAYVLFALALGVAVGTLTRKTLPAMAVTLAGYVGVRALVALVLRPHYMSPKTISSSVFGPPGRMGFGDWVLRTVTVTRAGAVEAPGNSLDFNYMAPRCRGLIPPAGTLPSQANLTACVHKLGLHAVSTYQPGSRFWAFQGIESGIFVAMAVALAVVTMWAVKRRIA